MGGAGKKDPEGPEVSLTQGNPDEVSVALDTRIPAIYNERNPLLDKAGTNGQDSQNNRYPVAIRFIMLSEICERFSYYGLRAILALYLSTQLNFSEHTATVIVHAFTMGAYTSTLFGGYISDAILGKYRTILYISMIYCVGSIVLSLTAIPGVTGYPPHWWGMALGLTLIALGTGGIKPVVSAFVGDQFTAEQSHLLDHIFFVFYFCINLGSVLSTLITPLMRTHVSTAAAFGLPAGLLIVATFIFWLGRNRYRTSPPTGSVLLISCKIVGTALKNCFKKGFRGQGHWLDRSLGFYPTETVQDVKTALGVLLVFLPLPLFWALFDQHSSRWIFQANKMNLHMVGDWYLEADQIPAINPMLVLIFVPLFDRAIYPFFAWLRVPLKPLRKMGIGMLIAASSFVCAALLQLKMNNSEEPVHIVWQLPQYLLLTCSEIMVSITGLELAYTQAPKTMKSLIMAGWQMTVAIGNLIVVIVAETEFLPQWQEFMFFAGLMVVAALIFAVIAYFYKYVEQKNNTT